MNTPREKLWPGFLIFVSLTWMAVYLANVDAEPFPKWLQVVCNFSLLVAVGCHIWRGRNLA